jgi:hypothetical protein
VARWWRGLGVAATVLGHRRVRFHSWDSVRRVWPHRDPSPTRCRRPGLGLTGGSGDRVISAAWLRGSRRDWVWGRCGRG